ncbi:maj_tail_phi13: phage major tail protein, phi13 family [Desulfitobacterium hafniense]|uniref:Maj_tail_phi13: phage major tail protein, phi13 family n=1 Tax=Desulfitobacterium hafniense TaxID=49338 RepID=A0A098AU86_DESHA|nr:major tail protein [Desulfitobacterium hafniense]CDV96350.1 maj_tail_phi13: phage major tail protein, phi13 family [Desulfitobacterium hafniense]
MANKVKYGLKSVYYSVIALTNGAPTYATPVAIPGAVNLTLSPKGDKTEFYADDIAYYVSSANQGYEGSLEVALLPDTFKKDVLGYVADASGALFEDANANTKNIALLFEFSGDANATRHVLYNVAVERPNMESSTKTASKEVKTETMNITASPAVNTGYVKAKAESTDSSYADWFTDVYEFVAPTGQGD